MATSSIISRVLFLPLLAGALVVSSCGDRAGDVPSGEPAGDTAGAAAAQAPANGSSGASLSVPGYAVVEVADGGVISGRVTLKGTAPKLPAFAITAHPDVCGTATRNNRLEVGPGGGIRWAVVYLESVERGKPFSPEQTSGLMMDQIGCQYMPHVMAAPVGAAVSVLNSDDAPHNVRIEDQAADNVLINRAQPSKGMRDTFRVAGPGAFPVGCDYHPWMNAYIFGVRNPYYAVTGADGSFTIAGVPPGSYRLKMWLNGVETRELKDTRGVMVGYRFGPPLVDSTEVTVTARGEAKADFTVDAGRLSGAKGEG